MTDPSRSGPHGPKDNLDNSKLSFGESESDERAIAWGNFLTRYYLPLLLVAGLAITIFVLVIALTS